MTRNLKAISKMILVLLLLITLIVGAILSYLWVMGYYISLDRVYPEDITVNIIDCAFDHQNTSFFNVTIQNPTSYESEEEAAIKQILVLTEDGVLHDKNETKPQLPYRFQLKGESKTFKCIWNWANYTGETIKIFAFLEEGSGPTFEAETPLVKLEITDISFNFTVSLDHFNLTVQNSPSSVTYVNITEVAINGEAIPSENLNVSLPHFLYPEETVSLRCLWDLNKYQNNNVSVAVYTLQGYFAHRTVSIPKPVTLSITDVLFNPADKKHFIITVENPTESVHNITAISAEIVDGPVLNITDIAPSLPFILPNGTKILFMCSCDGWTVYQERDVTVTIETSEEYTTSRTYKIPSE